MIAKILGFMLAATMLLAGMSSASAEWRRAGPVWHNGDAQDKCPRVCGRDAWDGNWRTPGPGFESVCNCLPRWRGGHESRGGNESRGSHWDRPRPSRTVQVNAGPIWHNGDAQNKCPRVCSSVGRWNGN